MIVLNETEWAREMLNGDSIGRNPFETLKRIARLYIDQQYKKQEVRRKLDTFILKCDPMASLPKWESIADSALRSAIKHPAIEIDHINITDPEIKTIETIKSVQIRRLAFTLLCLAKYNDIVNPKCDHWVTTKDNEIMKMANINTSVRRQSQMYKELNDLGLIRFSKRIDNTNVRVCFVQDGDTTLTVSDYRNLGYQYMRYTGIDYFECANCGVLVKREPPHAGGQRKYCRECAAEIAAQQNIASALRCREKRPV